MSAAHRLHPPRRLRGRARAGLVVASTGVLCTLGVAAPVASADADTTPPTLPAGCTQASVGATVTCTFTYTGGEQTFTVPAAVSSVDLSVVGARGGKDTAGVSSGGRGGAATITAYSVHAGQTLYVEVGGVGADSTTPGNTGVGGPGGFNGGGVGGDGSDYVGTPLSGGGGGGGASDVRTISRDDGGTLGSRVIVAAGGGGGCQARTGGGPGQAGTAGPGATGGGGATVSAGGAGGWSRGDGSLGVGGAGQPARAGYGGCGGGGGYFGGGGGSAGNGYSGSGGGGSNYAPGGTTGTAAAGQAAQVVISYELAGLTGVSLPAASAEGGTTVAGAVTLDRPATNDVTVELSSDSPTASVPASVIVKASKHSASFDVTTSQVTSRASATITATLCGASKSAKLTVYPPLAVTTTTLPAATAGQSYHATLHAAGGADGDYAWTLASGSMPPGLSLSQAGVISGTPSKAGTYRFAAAVNDPVSQTLTLTVAPASSAGGGAGNASGSGNNSAGTSGTSSGGAGSSSTNSSGASSSGTSSGGTSLADTGFPARPVGLVGLVLLLAGAVLLGTTRPRRRAPEA